MKTYMQGAMFGAIAGLAALAVVVTANVGGLAVLLGGVGAPFAVIAALSAKFVALFAMGGLVAAMSFGTRVARRQVRQTRLAVETPA